MINSCCRLGCPEWALRLLLETDPKVERAYAHRLEEMNDERKAIQADLEEQVFRSLPDDVMQRKVILASGNNWHPGLIGLAASKLANEHGKPSFVVGENYPNDEMARGSCRSVPGIDISELGDNSLRIDAEMPLDQINMRAYEQIEKSAPFGQGNERPALATDDLLVAHASTFGKDNKHAKVMLTDQVRSRCIPGIYWGAGDQIGHLEPGSTVEVAHCLMVDNYRSRPTLMMNILDLRYHNEGEEL